MTIHSHNLIKSIIIRSIHVYEGNIIISSNILCIHLLASLNFMDSITLNKRKKCQL